MEKIFKLFLSSHEQTCENHHNAGIMFPLLEFRNHDDTEKINVRKFLFSPAQKKNEDRMWHLECSLPFILTSHVSSIFSWGTRKKVTFYTTCLRASVWNLLKKVELEQIEKFGNWQKILQILILETFP